MTTDNPSLIRPLLKAVKRMLRLQHPLSLTVAAPAAVALRTLAAAARPSQDRLHLRNLFTDGRRYHVRTVRDGIRITSQSATWTNRRSHIAAIVEGEFVDEGAQSTLRLTARAGVLALGRALLLPTWMSAIIMNAPWSLTITLILMGLLYGSALAAWHFDARLQAHDILYFAQTAFEDLPTVDLPQLAAGEPVPISDAQRDFSAVWEQFYAQKRGG
jgi:hypothetical protein